MIRERRERLIVYRAATFDANRFRFFLLFSVLHVSEENSLYIFLLERFSTIVFVFNNIFLYIVRYLKKENYLNAYICIYLMYSFLFHRFDASIRRVNG